MNHRNLLPAHHLVTKRRRRATRRWVKINVAYAAVLTIAGVAYACSASIKSGMENRIAPTADVAQLNATLATLRQQSAVLNANWRSIQEVTVRPDWSVLLTVLAETLGDDVVLSGMDCTTTATPNVCTIAGVGRSQEAVAQWVLRIESLHLFKRVRLAQTAPQSLRGHEGVGFQLVCTLPDGDR